MHDTVYRVLWGALGDDDKAAIRDVAAAAMPQPSQALIDSIREAEQCLDIGGLPVADVLVHDRADTAGIDAGFLDWVRAHQL